MSLNRISSVFFAGAFLLSATALSVRAQNGYSRDTSQPVDQEYTKKIAEYTTEKFFNSPLTDYLPASPNVPTPQSVIGDVAGAPGKLPYAEDVYKYMRMLEKATPRVKVYTIGTTEEGREMIAVAVGAESLMAKLEENRVVLQTALAKSVVLKYTPHLVFHLDDSIERGARVFEILQQIETPAAETE